MPRLGIWIYEWGPPTRVNGDVRDGEKDFEAGPTSGCVRMNSPRALSSVYPLTPEPVVSTRFADEPYLSGKHPPGDK